MQFDIIDQTNYSSVESIYQQGMATGFATFQDEVPSWESWDKDHLRHSRLLVKEGDQIMGWAALSPVSGRCVYGGVAEISIYIAENARGKGYGKSLLNKLIAESERNGIWTIQAEIFPENIASIELHKKCGFRQIGFREKIGKKNGVWRDTLLMERRSKIIGQ